MKLKIKDKVRYLTRDPLENPEATTTATVKSISRIPKKNGTTVDESENDQLNSCTVVSLSNGRWCYGNQIVEIIQ